MPFTVTKSEQWVDISPVSGTLNPGASTDITITFDNSTNTFDYGVNVCELNFTNSNTGVTRQREVALNVPIIDSFVEEFDPSNPNPVDFENSMIVFTPDGTETYKMWTAEADRLPVNPAGGEQLDFTSDFSHQRPLNPGDSFPFFGNNYQTLYISKKGAINFEMSVWEAQYEETIWPSNIDYFVTRKRVCGFGADMVPESGGTVTWQVLADRAVVTFEDVPIKNELSNINTFQMELFYSGQIRFTYLNIDDDSPVIGLNGGELVLQNTSWHGESDISAYYHIGDVNGDEAITIVDALMTAHYSDGLDPAPFNPHLADVDGDGDIDLDDAYTINYYVVGLIDEFPCQYN